MVDDESETPASSRSASPSGDMNFNDGNQELQPGASAKEPAANDDTTNSNDGNQELQPGASGEGYITAADDTMNSDGGNQEL